MRQLGGNLPIKTRHEIMDKLINALSSLRDYTQTDFTLRFSSDGRRVWLYNSDKKKLASPGLSKANLATWVEKHEREF